MANRYQNQFLYTFNRGSVKLNCSFIVDSTNASGIRSLTGPGFARVFMHTSATPATGNPNPASGLIQVQLQDNYYKFLGASAIAQETITGSALTSTVANVTYQISALGTATAAQWKAVGLPAGVTAAVGVVFVATASQSIGGSGAVKALLPAGFGIELCGDPNLTINPVGTTGGYLYFNCIGPTNSSTTTPISVAPPDGTVIYIGLMLNNSSAAGGAAGVLPKY